MQATDTFKTVISAHLQSLAENDTAFAETLKKPAKNINDCATYILNEVKKSGKNGFADEEIFGMAIHYYDEDDIKVGSQVSGKVVVNHHLDAPKQVAGDKLGDNPTKTEVKRHGQNMPQSITSLPTPKAAKKKPEAKTSSVEQITLF